MITYVPSTNQPIRGLTRSKTGVQMVGSADTARSVMNSRLQLAQELRELMRLTGLRSTLQLAALLRNPEDRYPSDGLVRTYLLQRQDASDRFAQLLRVRKAEVEAQLANGVAALEIAGRVTSIYRIEPKQHLITILDTQQLAAAEFVEPGELTEVMAASLVVPREWVRRCEICDRPFIARSTRSRVCYRRDASGRMACGLEAARRRRKSRELSVWATPNPS